MSKNVFNSVNLFIAFQYLVARKKQSILATLGVLLGVTIFIVMISFMTGVNGFLDDAVFNGSPDIVIHQKPDKVKLKGLFGTKTPVLQQVSDIATSLGRHDNVKGFAQQTLSPAILLSETQQLPVSINGVFPDREYKMVDLERRLVHGDGFESLKDENAILLGVSLAKRLQVFQGDELRMILPNGRNHSLTVSGIFSFGISTIDNLRTYVNANTLQGLLENESGITNIHVKLKDREDLGLKNALLQQYGGIIVNDWMDGNKTIVIGNKVRNVMTWTISFALLLVAGFGIYNIMNITVIQKRKDIAVLKTMGYAGKDLVFIFLAQSFVIGSIGSLLGSFFGYLISYAISLAPLETSDFIIVDTYPITFEVKFYLLGASFGILTSLLAGYFPSKKASRVDPVTIIRDI
ncbi:FtsX-like permease family protein [Flavobacteriaceae bacterium 3-367]